MSTHITLTDNQGNCQHTNQSAPEYSSADLPQGWSGKGLEDAGIFMFILKVEKGAEEFAIHASEDTWLSYVVDGQGTLYTGDADNNKSEGIPYNTGDFITFNANTAHGWLSQGGESRLLFVKRA